MNRRPSGRCALAWCLSLVVLSLALATLLPVAAPDIWTPRPDDVPHGPITPPTDFSPLPDGALVVSPTGNDSFPGTAQWPLRTIRAAVDRATEGQTIALRRGVWHESVAIAATAGLHLRSWPGEQVWLDGTTPLTGFVYSGGSWRLDGYDVDLDTSPTFTRGAPDNTTPGWQFVASNAPLAADPQQIWLDDRPLQQVRHVSDLRDGTFAVDRSRRVLYLGSDPAGHRVAAGVRPKALVIDAPRTVISGLGVRRFVPSVPDFGAVSAAGEHVTMTDVLVTDSSTIGVSLQARGARLTRVQILRSGLLGLHVSRADDARLINLTVRANNTRGFNMAPTAGGAKITTSRRLHVVGGAYSANRGTGLWLDESVVDSSIVGVDAVRNADHGIHLELSEAVDVVSVRTIDNSGDGICIQNSGRVRIWHATAVGNRRQIDFLQDGRRPDGPHADGRVTAGAHGTPSWTIGDSEVVNSVLASGDGHGDALFAVEDLTRARDAADLGIRLRSNVYVISTDSGPRWSHVWTRAGDDPEVFTSPDQFAQRTGADTGSLTLPRLDGSEAAAAVAAARLTQMPADLAPGRPSPDRVGAVR